MKEEKKKKKVWKKFLYSNFHLYVHFHQITHHFVLQNVHFHSIQGFYSILQIKWNSFFCKYKSSITKKIETKEKEMKIAEMKFDTRIILVIN